MITNRKMSVKTAILLMAVPLIAGLICLGFGRYTISVPETVQVLIDGLKGERTGEMAYSVIFNVRLPRIILAMLVGAGLACAGAAFQGFFTNPLATPDSLGVASGASFGAVFAMMFDANLIVIQLMALVFGLISCLITYNISKIKGKSSIIMIVLAGMVVSAMFQAFGQPLYHYWYHSDFFSAMETEYFIFK